MVYDWDAIGSDDFLGSLKLSLRDVLEADDRVLEGQFLLDRESKHKKKRQPRGTLTLRLEWEPEKTAPAKRTLALSSALHQTLQKRGKLLRRKSARNLQYVADSLSAPRPPRRPSTDAPMRTPRDGPPRPASQAPLRTPREEAAEAEKAKEALERKAREEEERAMKKAAKDKEEHKYDDGADECDEDRAFVTNADVYARYELGPVLGEGATAVVRRGKHIQSGELVAIKVVDKLAPTWDEALVAAFEQEIRLTAALACPQLVAMRDVLETEAEIFIVLELVSGGELFDRIIDDGCLDEATSSRYLLDMLRGVKYG